jgi:hypothetical protein
VAVPDLNEAGELPLGVHRASLDEDTARFGDGPAQHRDVTGRLTRIHERATGTGKLACFVVFGSYVTAKADPNDVDVILVMQDDFDPAAYDEETRALFDHRLAADRWGASVFWLCTGSLFLETIDEFLG